MYNIPKSNDEFINRLLEFAKDFETYGFIDNNCNVEIIIEKPICTLKSDLDNNKTFYIKNWLLSMKKHLNLMIDSEDPDFLGHYLSECDYLIKFLDK